ncbi:FAD-binding domain-containing protein [Streptomyces sp. cf386]|uniref:FAD-binding domain-containing protein n=1 Tax=Streptomyces sp. cf386 TaxID=1761904 RepID=UPI000B091478|nr:FAD-binding domain-containing protein [Streptomyces sp. cf386]
MWSHSSSRRRQRHPSHRVRGAQLVRARRFDPDGEYVRRWLPELRHLHAGTVHRLPRLDEAGRAGLEGLDYPAPIVDLETAAARFRERRRAS